MIKVPMALGKIPTPSPSATQTRRQTSLLCDLTINDFGTYVDSGWRYLPGWWTWFDRSMIKLSTHGIMDHWSKLHTTLRQNTLLHKPGSANWVVGSVVRIHTITRQWSLSVPKPKWFKMSWTLARFKVHFLPAKTLPVSSICLSVIWGVIVSIFQMFTRSSRSVVCW